MDKKASLPTPSEGESKVDLFQGKGVRKVHHNGEWWLVLNDAVVALTDSKDPAGYIRDMRRRDPGITELLDPVEKGGGQIATPLRLEVDTPGGKQKMLCWNIEGIFRLVQSIPSKKAEPFKRWLARVGFERLQEIENPDLAIKRAIAIYRAKGYPDDWIENRITNKASREALTAAWKEHGIEKPNHIAVLTDAVSIETLGISTNDHKKMKGLVGSGQHLRDHMVPIELTLTTLGEQATTEIVRAKNPKGLVRHLEAAREGGGIAGDARRKIEAATGRSVISDTNFLSDRQKANNAKRLAQQISADNKKLPAPAEKPLKLTNPKGFEDTLGIIARHKPEDKAA